VRPRRHQLCGCHYCARFGFLQASFRVKMQHKLASGYWCGGRTARPQGRSRRRVDAKRCLFSAALDEYSSIRLRLGSQIIPDALASVRFLTLRSHPDRGVFYFRLTFRFDPGKFLCNVLCLKAPRWTCDKPVDAIRFYFWVQTVNATEKRKSSYSM